MAAVNLTQLVPDSENFRGRTAIVTGGCSGIGLKTATLLHQFGSNVILGDLRPPQGQQTTDLLLSPRAHYKCCDTTNWDSINAVFKEALAVFNSVDIVCVNAGINEPNGTSFATEVVNGVEEPVEPNLNIIDVNVKGSVYTCLLALHYMKANKNGGSIVITSSTGGYFTIPGLPVYSASKHALVGLLRTLTPTALASGVAVSLVAPGLTETPLNVSMLAETDDSNKSEEERLESLYSRFRAIGISSQPPEVVAKAILYLVQQGKEAAGESLFIQEGEVFLLESELTRTRPEWLKLRLGYLNSILGSLKDDVAKAVG